MIRSVRQRDVPDETWLGWLLVWGIVLTIAFVSVLAGSPADQLPTDSQTVLGGVMGGLAAVWVSAATWVGLIHLPNKAADSAEHQRIGPRIAVVALLLVDLVILVYGIRQDLALVTQLMVMVMISVSGPLIVWQYTRRRIYRETASVPGRQSIRQILGMVFTIALSSAALRLSDRWFGLSGAMFALILSVGWTWTMMVWIMLGRWWWLVIALLPIFFVQILIVSSLIDAREAIGESQRVRFQWVIIGHHLFAMLFLSLMRSSGHRWFGRQPV